LFSSRDTVEIVHIINKIDIGSEIISRIDTNLKTGGLYYTDKTGYESHKRITNSTLPIPANYYPLVNSVYLKDESGDDPKR